MRGLANHNTLLPCTLVTDPQPVEAPVSVAPKPRSGWLMVTVVAVLALLVGATATAGVLLVTGLPGQPAVHHYKVTVFLEPKVTAEQKAAIAAVLPAFNPTGDITFESHDEAWRKFQDSFKDAPDLLNSTKAEDLPESYTLDTEGRLFDCTGYAKVRHLPGVDEVHVSERYSNYIATITCDAEYAKP